MNRNKLEDECKMKENEDEGIQRVMCLYVFDLFWYCICFELDLHTDPGRWPSPSRPRQRDCGTYSDSSSHRWSVSLLWTKLHLSGLEST